MMPTDTVPEHLRLARLLADRVGPKTNHYGSPAVIVWPADDGTGPCSVTCRCAPLVTACLRRAYATDFRAWVGTTSPDSARYHEAIAAGDHFAVAGRVTDVRPGDVLAIRHRSGSTSGHTAIVDAAPTPRTASRPIVAGTTQYDLRIVDVTSSPHGDDDSRAPSGEGVGRGTMRLYADASGAIVGYTWSARSSTYHPATSRPLAVGRYL